MQRGDAWGGWQACLAWWSTVSPYGGFGSTAALVFVLLVAGVKAVYEDVKRHHEDNETNKSTAHVLQGDGAAPGKLQRCLCCAARGCLPAACSGPQWLQGHSSPQRFGACLSHIRRHCNKTPPPANSAGSLGGTALRDVRRARSLALKPAVAAARAADRRHPAAGSFVDVPWRKVSVGQVLKVHDDELFPADLLCLHSALPDGVCFIRTTNLDGETNLKIRRCSLRAGPPLPRRQRIEQDPQNGKRAFASLG